MSTKLEWKQIEETKRHATAHGFTYRCWDRGDGRWQALIISSCVTIFREDFAGEKETMQACQNHAHVVSAAIAEAVKAAYPKAFEEGQDYAYRNMGFERKPKESK